MSAVSMELRGADAPLADLSAMIARAANPRGMFENIGMSLVTSTQHRFETGTAPDGSVWPPSIRALAEGGKTLVDSARLMQSISYVAMDASVEVGTNLIYSAIHQLGGEIKQPARKQNIHFKRGHNTGELLQGFRKKSKSTETRTVDVAAHVIKMPARPFLGLDEDDTREIIRIADDWVAGQGALR